MFVLEQINIDVEKTNTKYDAKLSVGINFLSETLFLYSCTAFKLIFLLILSMHKYVKFKRTELFLCWQNWTGSWNEN